MDSQPHTKDNKKNIKEYHYFLVPVNINNELYTAKLTARQKKNFAELYVIDLKLNKIVGRMHTAALKGSISKALLPTDSSINDLISDVNIIDYSDNTKKHTELKM